MGIIIRQSLKSTIISYVGVALGALNMLVLFPRIFEPDEFGLTRVLLSVSALLAQFSEFGGTHVINKYFPFFKDEKETLKRFVFWVLLNALASYAVIAFTYYLFKSPILHGYTKNNSGLILEYYGYVFPIALFVLVFNLLEAYSRSMMRITVPTILREVYLRIFLLVTILLFHFGVIGFEMFIVLFAASYGSAMIVMAVYVTWLDRHFIAASIAFSRHKMVKEVFVFGIYSILSYAVWKAVTQLDVIMLSYMDSLEGVAVYSIAFYIVTLMMLPQRFLHQISYPILSQHIQKKNWDEVRLLYQRVALNQTVIGIFLFIIIWVNLDNLYHFLPEKYHSISMVILVLAVGKIFDMATSLNGEIILLSQHFKFNLLAGLGLLVLCIVTNYIFIPIYGILGAAIGTTLALTIFNVVRIFFVHFKWGFLPFKTGMMKAILIGAVTTSALYFLPAMNVYIDLLVRSAAAFVLFASLSFGFSVSDDLNQFFMDATTKFQALLRKDSHPS